MHQMQTQYQSYFQQCVQTQQTPSPTPGQVCAHRPHHEVKQAVSSLLVEWALAWPAPGLRLLGLQRWLSLMVSLHAGAAAGASPAAAPAPNGCPKQQLASPQPPALTSMWPGARSSTCKSSSNTPAAVCPAAHAATSAAAAAALAAVSCSLVSQVWVTSASSRLKVALFCAIAAVGVLQACHRTSSIKSYCKASQLCHTKKIGCCHNKHKRSCHRRSL